MHDSCIYMPSTHKQYICSGWDFNPQPQYPGPTLLNILSLRLMLTLELVDVGNKKPNSWLDTRADFGCAIPALFICSFNIHLIQYFYVLFSTSLTGLSSLTIRPPSDYLPKRPWVLPSAQLRRSWALLSLSIRKVGYYAFVFSSLIILEHQAANAMVYLGTCTNRYIISRHKIQIFNEMIYFIDYNLADIVSAIVHSLITAIYS